MKNYRFIQTVIIGMCVVFAGWVVVHKASAYTLGPNLISNGSLENGSTAPTGWEAVSGATNNKSVFKYPVAGFDGARAARIDVSTYKSGDIFWLPSNSAVTAGKQYQFSVYTQGSAPSVVIATYLDSTNKALSYVTLGNTASSSTWKLFTATTTVPTKATQVRIQNVVRKVGFIEVDGYNLSEILSSTSTPATTTPPVATTTPPVVPPPATTTPPVATSTPPTPPPSQSGSNLIKNGDLETANGSTPLSWNKGFWGSATRTFSYPVAGKNGGKAAKLTVSKYKGGDSKWYADSVEVSPTTQVYRFTEDYTSTVVSSLSAEVKMQDGSYQYLWLADVPASASWTTLSQDMILPKGAVSFTIFHALSANGSLTLDNATLLAMKADFPVGMVTLTFDDGLSSQYTNARPILNAAHLKAGYYIITDSVRDISYTPMYMSWQEVKTLQGEGNEIGSHTVSHPYLTTLTNAKLQNELVSSFNSLKAQGMAPTTIVYPYGDVNQTVEAAVKNAGYKVARGSDTNLNTAISDKYDLADMRADLSTNAAAINSWVDDAIANKRWLIIELHDIEVNGNEYSITPATFQSVVNHLVATGVKVVTLEEGAVFLSQ